MNFEFWSVTAEAAAGLLKTDAGNGLKEAEAARRVGEVGENSLPTAKKPGPVHILLAQFTNTMVLVLLGATVISGIMGDMVDAGTILAIVILNGVLGFVQEYRAERSLAAIKQLMSQEAVVVRGGQVRKIEARYLVPGDVVILEAGDRVPADIRLTETFSLTVDESVLTGESVPVSKHSDTLPEHLPLPERHNMAYMGTSVTRGRGRGIVTGTGTNTIMGEIAHTVKESGEGPTPLQQRLDSLGKWLVVICVAVCLAVFLLGIIRGEEMVTMFMAGVSLAVAAIPEGLAAIVTVVLALGVTRMARRNAIVRRLPAVETLGCTTVICSDKTGTLTQNRMTVRKVLAGGRLYEVHGEGYEPEGYVMAGSRRIKGSSDREFTLLCRAAAACNHAEITGSKGHHAVQGDPTEGALLVLAARAGVERERDIRREIPFDSERKMMSVVVGSDQPMLFAKGAMDVILPRCTRQFAGGREVALFQEGRQQLARIGETWSEEAYRVLAIACRTLKHDYLTIPDGDLEQGLTFLGLVGMIDPPRPGVKKSVRQCLAAGIIPVMITGDHPATAAAIATEIGLGDGRQVVPGPDINAMNDRQLADAAETIRVFARVTPQQKHRIVRALKQRGHVVAMTGDGVNDAPAVKEADIGIAMGRSGTEVTREASDMVLADDDFSTIVAAVHEGRAIYDNIRKFLRYLLGCNIGEVLTMGLASLLGLPLPLLPIQILWVNLVTDGLPAMGLGVEPPEPGIMNRRPRPPREGIFARGLGTTIANRGLFIGVMTLLVLLIGMYGFSPSGQPDLALARTMALSHLVFAQLFYVFECRSEVYSPFELGFFRNRFLIFAVLVSALMQLAAVYVPLLAGALKTVSLTGEQWAVIILFGGFRFLWLLAKYTLGLRQVVGTSVLKY